MSRNHGLVTQPRMFSALLERIGNEEGPSSSGEIITNLEAVARQVFNIAKQGVPWAVMFIAERLDGKPTVGNPTPAGLSVEFNVPRPKEIQAEILESR